ncbi:MAG: acylneuraminate cytidylyltransferase [Spirochaetota bacterium]
MVRYQVALQVRLGSRRLPRKALLPLAGGPCVLDWVLRHLRQSRRAERFLLLCPERDAEVLEPYARRYGFVLFGGPEQDVLRRFVGALERYPSEYCFRATGDNPLVLGSLLDFMAERHGGADYSDYYWVRGLPYGFAAELFCVEALLSAGSEGLPEACEHVTPALYRNPQRYSVVYDELPLLSETRFEGVSKLRLTLDTPEDYAFLQGVFAHLQGRRTLEGPYPDFREVMLDLSSFPL